MGRATMFPALSLGKDREATGGVRTSANEMFGLSKFRMKDTSVKFYMQFGIWTKIKTLGRIENPNNFTEKALSIVMEDSEIELLAMLLQAKKVRNTLS